MSTVEELTGVVAGLIKVVKDLTMNVNHVTSQVGQLATAAQEPAPAAPLAVNQATPSLRLPTLQLPTFRCDEEQRNDIADFLERFVQQTSHLTDELKTTLLEQQCVGDWPRSVLSIAKTTAGFAEKTAKEQFDIFTDSLKREFGEPKSVKCRRLASELSSMQQHDNENVDQFTFRFKNVLHQLEKLGERVAKDCPTYVISQFISKVKPEIAQHLALKAEELTTLDKAAESARRVELSFNQRVDNGPSTAPQSLSSWKPSSALFTSPPDKNKSRFARRNSKKRECWTCGSPSHVAKNCTSQRNEHMSSNKPEICRNFNRRLHSTCEKANNKCTHGRFHKCSTCNKWGCKAVRHESQQANAVTAINQPASPSNPPVSSEETLFGLPAFTDPTAVPANTQTQVGNRNILWTSVISAGKSLPLPLDSCCSVSLVSADHAQAVITERPLLQYRKLAEPIPVSVADAKANLTATAVMDIPIKWNNGKDCVFTMLVVPRLTWPILFGENHLHATKALVDHAQPSVTFRHPSMQFSVQCSLDNPLKGFANSTLPSSQVTSSSDPTGSATPHVGVTCLLTDAPLPGQPKGSTSLRRGLNLVTVCLTLSSVFVGFRGTNPSLWLEGQEVQPGVKVLSGPFDWQSAQSNVIPKEPPGAVCHASLCDIQEDQCQCPETEELPDFTSVYYTTVAIECKQKHSSLPQNVILGHIRPPTAQDQEIFQQAADATSEQLAEAWVTWVDTQTQPELSTCTSKANTTRPTLHELSGKHSTPQSEMQAAGLDSALLSPFREPVELAQDTAEFLPDTAHAPLDPYSEEYYNALLSALKLDTDMYSHVDPEILLEFKGLLRKYSTAFWLPGIPLTEVQGFEHHIHTDNSLPVYKHPYRKSPAELRAIKTEIQRMLKLKIIEPSNSEWGAPCILVRKPPENGVEQPPRFVVDYRGLNSVTRSDGYPIPSVANVLDSVSQGKVFGRCDLASGYWQIPLRKQDQPKSAFCTHVGLYHFLRLPFGMKTAPSTFQRILNTVFADYLRRWLIAYVDDLITWAQTQREALHQYSLLLERAVQVNIQFKPSKCVFFATEIELLGHYVNQAGRKPNSRGIEAITAMNSPANITQLKQFLGLCGYFRDYVPNMSNHTLALRQLLKKGVPFHWTSEHEKDFKALKHLVTGPTVMLYHPRWDDNFEVHVDASKHGCGAMLAQEINGELRPVRFASRAFSPTESRWTTMQQELFAVKWGLDQFRPYILGRRIKVVTDHANLKWLTTIAPQQAKVARWCMSMAEFDFYIQHRPGVQNVVPDVLSRYPVAASPDCHLITLPDSRIETFLLTALSADVLVRHSVIVTFHVSLSRRGGL